MTRIALAVLVAALGTSARALEPAAAAPAPVLAVQPPTSLTSGSDGRWSVLARAGTYIPVMGNFNVYRPGFAIEVGMGRRIGSVLTLELSGLYTATDSGIPLAATVPQGTGLTTQNELKMAGGLATLQATWATGPVELYAGAGVGFYWVEQYEVVLGATFGGGYLAHDNAVGAHACAGVLVSVTPSMFLSADLRYTYLEPQLFGSYQRADGLGLALGVGYRF